MMPRLVFVHGIGGARDTDQELHTWAAALAKGMRLAGHSEAAAAVEDGKVDSVFASYADLFARPQQQGTDLSHQLTADEARLLSDVMLEVIDGRLAVVGESVTSDASGYGMSDDALRVLMYARAQAQPAGQAQGTGSLVRQAVNVATTLLALPAVRRASGWVVPKLMVRDLAQVARYLARSEAQGVAGTWEGAGEAARTLDQRIRDRVLAALREGPAVVVAHSLGTVVALEALHHHAGAVPLMVTLGSPISMRTVVWPRLVPQPPCVPDGVGRWLNFWDRDDIIAARPVLEADVLPNAVGVRPTSARVDSDGIWVHSAVKYLGQPAVAGPIAEALGLRHRDASPA
ncbi:hypothetical protein PV703_27015 [Streptomyces sp. ME01-24h]|nr:hypothetical protein [Streptomyces sp. ME01-24h]